ncbi:glycoside hydrolase family 15 protein [Candidatus Woesearchaeota archaeon]|nr:glycoside hydrolase family 15 protein [Candidatus Woesearchaeota archaeon]
MTRHIALGNGSLLVNIDKWLQVRDFYYPHVGEENHLLGHAHRIGIFTDGKISWINHDSWERKVKYMQHTLVTDCSAKNREMQIELEINDCVECEKDIFLRKIKIKNMADRDRNIRIFFHHDFHLYSDGIGDTAGYEPTANIVFHYKRRRHFIINAVKETSDSRIKGDIFEYNVGQADGKTIEDADNGKLAMNPIAQGNVDSIISVNLDMKANSEEIMYYWICCARNFEKAGKMNSMILKHGPAQLLKDTEMCWLGMANKCKVDFQDLPQEVISEFKKSILIIRTQIDTDGAIIAANDSDNLQYNRDTYSYMWPRDGALVSIALQKAGYNELVEPFYLFCKKILPESGFFLHKYNPDGSLGSSWHPWIKGGKAQLPLQEDETALVVYALWDYFGRAKSKNFVMSLYKPLIMKAADFLANYIDQKTGLPLESYDLWEERHGIFAFTCCTVYAGLVCASKFAKEFGDNRRAEFYLKTANDMKKAIEEFLYDEEHGRFLRAIYSSDKGMKKDYVIDSSLYALSEFGVFDADDDRVKRTMEAVEQALWVNTDIGGFARYEKDRYHKVSHGFDKVPGNPWFVCAAWMGKYYVRKAKSREELKKAMGMIVWIMEHSLSTGIMPEQIDPFTGEALSVSPLTWSHAEFIDLVMEYLKRQKELQ